MLEHTDLKDSSAKVTIYLCLLMFKHISFKQSFVKLCMHCRYFNYTSTVCFGVSVQAVLNLVSKAFGSQIHFEGTLTTLKTVNIDTHTRKAVEAVQKKSQEKYF